MSRRTAILPLLRKGLISVALAVAGLLASIYQDQLEYWLWVILLSCVFALVVTWAGWRRVMAAGVAAWSVLLGEASPTKDDRGKPERTPEEGPRVVATRRLLLEAATLARAHKGDWESGDIIRITKASWFAYKTVCFFLDGAFVVSPSEEFTRFLEMQKHKFGSDFDLAESTAMYLERLAGRVESDDLDEGFSLPGEFRQLNPETWPTNKRAEFGEALPRSPNEWPDSKISRVFDVPAVDSLTRVPTLPDVVVSLKRNFGSGATPGMWPVLTNNSPETFEGVVVEVSDIRCWNDQHKKWTTSGDVYGASKTFPRRLFWKTFTLHPREPQNGPFLSADPPSMHRLLISGHGEGGTVEYKIRAAGIWQISYEIRIPESASMRGVVCFEWNGTIASPVPCPDVQRLRNSKLPSRQFWLDAEATLGRMEGEVMASASVHSDGEVAWSVFPHNHMQPKGTQQTVDRFLAEARRLGKAIEGCDLKRKFAKAKGDDTGDDWLNVVATFLNPEPQFTGSGSHFGRTHDTEWIMCAIDASKHACALLASMAE